MSSTRTSHSHAAALIGTAAAGAVVGAAAALWWCWRPASCTDAAPDGTTVECVQVDAFADAPMQGNPAMVCLVPPHVSDSLTDDVRLAVAAEVNLSETAFVTPRASDSPPPSFRTATHFSLRWFTPRVEVPLCGHATLAAAGALFFHVKSRAADGITFHTASGALTVRRDASFGPTGVSMRFPANPVATSPPTLAAAAVFGAVVDKAVPAALVADVLFSPGTQKLIVVLVDTAGRADLEALAPDLAGMHAVDQSALPVGGRVRGLSVTCRSDVGGVHFLSRYFTPWNGIEEDPVNGSSHTALAPLWTARLGMPAGAVLTGLQCSQRSGRVSVQVVDDGRTVVLGGPTAVFSAGRMVWSSAA